VWWHYQDALVGYLRVSRNFWWYFFHVFSIPQLASSLYAPYKRQVEKRAYHFSLATLSEYLILNFLSRLLGFLVRVAIITTGFFILLVYTTLSIAGFTLWLAAPVLIILGISGGVFLMSEYSI
jgi:hypothetical protein